MSEVEDLVKEWNELSEEYKSLEVNKSILINTWNCETRRKTCNLNLSQYLSLLHHRQSVNQTYLELLDEFEELQSKCSKDIAHQRYRIAQLIKGLK